MNKTFTKLRFRTMRIAILSVAIVFTVSSILIYVLLNVAIARQSDQMTQIISNNQGKVPDLTEFPGHIKSLNEPVEFLNVNVETQYITRYFVVNFDKNLNVVSSDLDNIAGNDVELAQYYSREALKSGKTVGYYEKYRFRISSNDDCIQCIFLDVSEAFHNVTTLMGVLGIVFLGLFILISIMFIFTSKRSIEPFETNSKIQRQFITDAGHELKTPLAVIQANTEVLQYQLGEDNKWLVSTKKQVNNMSKLISQLMILAKNEEISENISLASVNFSKIVKSTFAEFHNIFKQKNIKIVTSFADNVTLNGNYELLTRLISILSENASKYVLDNGMVEAKLEMQGKYSVFTIANTDSNKKKINCRRLFDRFYRADDSRNSSTGGHGIGLSIAYRICSQHSGKIEAEQKNGMMIFRAFIPINLRISKKTAPN